MGYPNGTECCYNEGIGIKTMNIRQSLVIKNPQRWVTLVKYITLDVVMKKELELKMMKHNTIAYYQNSAEMDHASGIYDIGCCYYEEIGVEKDEHKAIIYYQRLGTLDAVMMNNWMNVRLRAFSSNLNEICE